MKHSEFSCVLFEWTGQSGQDALLHLLPYSLKQTHRNPSQQQSPSSRFGVENRRKMLTVLGPKFSGDSSFRLFGLSERGRVHGV